MAPKAGFIAAYERSVHGAALLGGNGAAANCVDCHGSHEMRRGNDAESRVARPRIPETCSRCHGDVAARYATSAHGEALAKGSPDAPGCTTCHGGRTMPLHTD